MTPHEENTIIEMIAEFEKGEGKPDFDLLGITADLLLDSEGDNPLWRAMVWMREREKWPWYRFLNYRGTMFWWSWRCEMRPSPEASPKVWESLSKIPSHCFVFHPGVANAIFDPKEDPNFGLIGIKGKMVRWSWHTSWLQALNFLSFCMENCADDLIP